MGVTSVILFSGGWFIRSVLFRITVRNFCMQGNRNLPCSCRMHSTPQACRSDLQVYLCMQTGILRREASDIRSAPMCP
jgi:hypothetical protein